MSKKKIINSIIYLIIIFIGSLLYLPTSSNCHAPSLFRNNGPFFKIGHRQRAQEESVINTNEIKEKLKNIDDQLYSLKSEIKDTLASHGIEQQKLFNLLQEQINKIESTLHNVPNSNQLVDEFQRELERINKNFNCKESSPVIPPEFVEKQQEFNKKLNQLITNVDNCMVSSKDLNEKTNTVLHNTDTIAENTKKLQDKLISFAVSNSDCEQKMFEKFEKINAGLTALETIPKQSENLIDLNNQTLNVLKNIGEGCSKMDYIAKQNTEHIVHIIEDTLSTKQLLEKIYDGMNMTNTKLNDTLQVCDKFNNMQITNSSKIPEIHVEILLDKGLKEGWNSGCQENDSKIFKNIQNMQEN